MRKSFNLPPRKFSRVQRDFENLKSALEKTRDLKARRVLLSRLNMLLDEANAIITARMKFLG
jgi:hypothetical protein